MNLHEYQAKKLFADYGLPVSEGYAVDTADEAVEAAEKIGGTRWVVKVQVHAGGRGKAGGVKLADSLDEVRAFADQWIGKRLVTFQTDQDGQPVSKIYVESCTDIATELYLGAVVDRGTRRVVFMASTEGGVEIEQVAEEMPEKILKTMIDPFVGPQPYQGRELAFKLGLEGKQVQQFSALFMGLAKLFHELDCSLLEINPLVITENGDLHCLDAKINIDSNALFRQKELQEMHDPTQEDPRESEASKYDLSYVSLDGNIGCMVNGAGLAMGTMDTIKFFKGNPANFLDVGGTATQERVAKAFKIILDDPEVKVVLVNIFGGIVRCDLIAQGIVAAIDEVGVEIPVVVRLEGNSAEKGLSILSNSSSKIQSKNSLEDAARAAVELAK